MAKIVTAPLVLAYKDDGSHLYLYEGAPLPNEGLRDGEVQRLTEAGFIGDTETSTGPPPQTGKGSGLGAWQEYAQANNVEVADGASKEEIVAAVDAAGVPVE